jgi:hypothetical protein
VSRQWSVALPYAKFDGRGVKHPVPPLSLNKKMNRHAERELKRRIRNEVALLARSAKVPHLAAGTVTLVWCPRVVRPRDTDNPIPTLKPAIDGLVDAGVFDDDNAAIVRSAVAVMPADPKQCGLWLHILEHPDGLPPQDLSTYSIAR